jgi:hypothetical protein
MLAASAAALALLALVLGSGKTEEAFSQEELEPIVSYEQNSGAQFYSYDSGSFFFCTKDSVAYIDSKGRKIWEEIVSLSSPVSKHSGGYLALADPKGRIAHVFNEGGKLYEASLENPILSFSVNGQGYLTVIGQSQSRYLIELYGGASGERLWYYSFSRENVFPVSADASSDGKMVAISFLDINVSAQHDMSSTITFLYTSAADARKYTDGAFAGADAPDQIVASVIFMEGDKLLAISDTEVSCYAPSGSSAKKVWSFALGNSLDRFCVYGGKSFALAFGDPILNSPDAKDAGYVAFYSMNGKKTGEYAFGGIADSLSMSWGSAIIGSGRTFHAVSSRGRLLWKHTALQDISQAIFLQSTNTFLAAQSGGAVVVQR